MGAVKAGGLWRRCRKRRDGKPSFGHGNLPFEGYVISLRYGTIHARNACDATMSGD